MNKIQSNHQAEGDTNTSPSRAAWNKKHEGATQNLLERDAAVFMHQALSTPCLDVLTHSKASQLTTLSGKSMIDFHGNSLHQIGYGHPAVTKAIREQLETLPFCPRRFTCDVSVRFAEKLAELAPNPLGKVLLAPGGSEVIGMALKLARYATGRHKTISMWDSFHGAGLDAASVGGEAMFRKDVGPLLSGTEHVPPPGMARRFFGDDGFAAERLADYIDYIMEVQGDVAALIAEPVRWTTVEVPPADFWPRIRKSCDKHNVLLIFDEIPSALGRTGTFFVHEQLNCVPDMVAIGKGLGGGVFPQAALIVNKNLDICQDIALGHYTHEKSTLGSAAGLATIETIEKENLLASAKKLGELGKSTLEALSQKHPVISEIRQIGAFFGAVLEKNKVPDCKTADRVLYECLENGLSLKVGSGNVLTLCPPLNIDRHVFLKAFDILDDALKKCT